MFRGRRLPSSAARIARARRPFLHALAVTALFGAYVHSAFVLHHPRHSPDGAWYVERALVLHESGASPPLEGVRPLYLRWLNLLMRADPDFAGYLRCLDRTVPRWPEWDPRWAERYGGVREGKTALASACRPLANVGIYAQALLGAVGVALVGLAGWLASRRALVAYLSVLVALLLDGYVHQSVGYMPDSLVVPLFTGVNVCLARLARDRRPPSAPRTAGTALLGGLLLGALILTRPPYELLLAVLPAAAAVLAFRNLACRRAIGIATAGVVLGAALIAMPWAARQAGEEDAAGDSITYGSGVLVVRLSYNALTWRQWLAAFPFWTSMQEWEAEPGNDAATRWFGTSATAVLDKRHPDFLERRWSETARVWKARLEDGPRSLVKHTLTDLPKHLAVSVPLAWRGMSEFRSPPCGIGPYAAVFWLLFLFAFAPGAPGNRRVLAALTFCPAVVLIVQALVSAGVSRYNVGLVVPLAVGSALCLARTIDGARRRLRRRPAGRRLRLRSAPGRTVTAARARPPRRDETGEFSQ